MEVTSWLIVTSKLNYTIPLLKPLQVPVVYTVTFKFTAQQAFPIVNHSYLYHLAKHAESHLRFSHWNLNMLGTLQTMDVHVLFLLPRIKIQLKCEVIFLFKKAKCLFWSHIFSLRISAVLCQHLVLHHWCIFWTSLNFLEQNHLHTHIYSDRHTIWMASA